MAMTWDQGAGSGVPGPGAAGDAMTGGDAGSSFQRSGPPWWQSRAMVFALIGGLVACLVAALAIPLASGGGVATGWFGTLNGGVAFIQWSDTGGAVSGTAQITAVSGTAPTQVVSSSTAAVSGRIDGGQISLSFDGGPTVFGSFNQTSFDIDVPVHSGGYVRATFKSAAIEQYQQDVARLRGQADRANADAQQRIATAQAHSKVTAAASTVTGNLNSLAQAVQGLHTRLSTLSTGLSTLKTAVSQSANMASQAQAEVGAGRTHTSVCAKVETAQGAAENASGDVATIGADTETLVTGIKSVRSDEGTLRNAYQQFQTAATAAGGYEPTGAPTQAQITAAIASAEAAVKGAVTTANKVIDQANGLVKSAYTEVKAVGSAIGCTVAGTGPTLLSPLSVT